MSLEDVRGDINKLLSTSTPRAERHSPLFMYGLHIPRRPKLARMFQEQLRRTTQGSFVLYKLRYMVVAVRERPAGVETV